MDTATAMLLFTTGVIMFATLIAVSYKTGFVAYSIWSFTRKEQPQFTIDTSKIGSFILALMTVFALNLTYCMLVLRDSNEIESMLILSLFNTLVIGYGMSFWGLLKEKEASPDNDKN